MSMFEQAARSFKNRPKHTRYVWLLLNCIFRFCGFYFFVLYFGACMHGSCNAQEHKNHGAGAGEPGLPCKHPLLWERSSGIKHAVSCRHSDCMRQTPGEHTIQTQVRGEKGIGGWVCSPFHSFQNCAKVQPKLQFALNQVLNTMLLMQMDHCQQYVESCMEIWKNIDRAKKKNSLWQNMQQNHCRHRLFWSYGCSIWLG